MKNENKHDGLTDSNVRDFLGKQLGYGYEGEVKIIQAKIAELQNELAIAKKSQAARDLIRINGWAEFDVSDDIENYHRDSYFSFIGTVDEKNLVFGS